MSGDEARREVEEETVATAVAGLRAVADRGARVWLFECPARARPPDAVGIEHWPTTVYREHIEVGDPAVLWVSGRDAGVHAVGQVVGELVERGDECLCPLDLYVDLFEVPVRKAELVADPRFVDAPIIRTPHAGSPHLLTAGQLGAILDLALVPFWARRASPLGRRVACLIQDDVDAAAGARADLPVVSRDNAAWAASLGVSAPALREALNELFFLTRELGLPDELLGFTFDTRR